MGSATRHAKFIAAGGAAWRKTVAFGRLKADEPRKIAPEPGQFGLVKREDRSGRIGPGKETA